MEENTNQVQEQTAVEEQGKTFSQEDVNRIVGERLAKEKAKNESDWQQREQDLQRRELQMTAKEYLSEKNIPVELLDALNYTDEETLQKSVLLHSPLINWIVTKLCVICKPLLHLKDKSVKLLCQRLTLMCITLCVQKQVQSQRQKH